MSEIKVNKISPRTNCGTVTLGDSGDTITIPSGVTITNNGTQTGFGRTGTVNWQTTVKTGDFTAANGEGYFVDTSSGAVTMTLPASPSAGNIVSVKDYAYNFGTNALTVARNGSPIGGGSDLNISYNSNGAFLTFIYIDGTKGWLVTDDSTNVSDASNAYITATGGTVTTACTNFKVHTFTSPGTFCITAGGGPLAVVDYFVVAGGGGGGSASSGYDSGGGGGGGGFRLSNTTCMPSPQTSPLVAPNSPSPAAILFTPGGHPITVGAGGTGAAQPSNCRGASGSASILSSITSAGGGGGGSIGAPATCKTGADGGSGGGAGGGSGPTAIAGGSGNTPSVSPAQGTNGGPGGGAPINYWGGGGGGAACAGAKGESPNTGGPGGSGSFVVQAGFAGCNGTPGPVSGARYFAGGGGAGGTPLRPTTGGGSPGTGGGGNGGPPGIDATANTGGGGGGGEDSAGGNGGSGIVIIRYRFQA